MSLQGERCDLAYDTDCFRSAAQKYEQIAEQLRECSKKLDIILSDLTAKGWTTAAGEAFKTMAAINWEENIEKYAALLSTLKEILITAAENYEGLTTYHIEHVKLEL